MKILIYPVKMDGCYFDEEDENLIFCWNEDGNVRSIIVTGVNGFDVNRPDKVFMYGEQKELVKVKYSQISKGVNQVTEGILKCGKDNFEAAIANKMYQYIPERAGKESTTAIPH